MDTLENIVEIIRHNETPFWWLKSGNSKVGENTKESDINASIDILRKNVGFLPAGTYKIETSRKPADRSGSFQHSFQKGSNAQSTSTMQAAPTSNIFNVPDATYAHLQAQFEQAFMMKQMFEWYKKFSEEWPAYKKKIDEMYEDADGDGTPDFFQMAQKAGDTVKSVSDIKKVFDGGSGFRL